MRGNVNSIVLVSVFSEEILFCSSKGDQDQVINIEIPQEMSTESRITVLQGQKYAAELGKAKLQDMEESAFVSGESWNRH